MAKIIVLTVEEENGTPQVGIICSGDVTIQQSLVVCQAAVNHFQEQCMAAELEKRLAERIVELEVETPSSE